MIRDFVISFENLSAGLYIGDEQRVSELERAHVLEIVGTSSIVSVMAGLRFGRQVS
jgi:hypothetical protein